MQGSVNSLSLHGQSSKGLTEQPQLSLLCLEFPLSWKTQLADWKCYIHRRHLQTMLGGRGLWPTGLLRVQSGGGEGRWWDQGGMYESRLSRPTGRVGELGEVGSPLAVEWLHTVIWGQRTNNCLALVQLRDARHIIMYICLLTEILPNCY